jgi:hypothetical protein
MNTGEAIRKTPGTFSVAQPVLFRRHAVAASTPLKEPTKDGGFDIPEWLDQFC